jgi:hypothetical protein
MGRTITSRSATCTATLGEFDHRYNSRELKDGERMVQTIRQTTGRRLTYRKPTEDS